MNKYTFKEYSEKYPQLFEKEKGFLIRILPGVFGLEHIGSTSVKGLGGRGIIDILVSFKKKEDLKNAKAVLLQNNYEVIEFDRDKISLETTRGFLFKHHFHVHLTLIGSNIWKETLLFRDRLRKDSEFTERYSALKKKAIMVAEGEGKIYRKLKESFIKKNSK
jgi:GrpB-like predicted nucleotidyltransferase (UPF0157 family)